MRRVRSCDLRHANAVRNCIAVVVNERTAVVSSGGTLWWCAMRIHCERAQLQNSIKLLLRDAKKHRFQIYFLLKSID